MPAVVSPLLGGRQTTPPVAFALKPVDPGPSSAEAEAESAARTRRAAIAHHQGYASTTATSARGMLGAWQLAVPRR